MTQIHQAHGDHWSSICGDMAVIVQSLPEMMQNAGLIAATKTNFTDEKTGVTQVSQIFGLNYPLSGPIDCLFLIAASDTGNEIVSIYPHCINGLVLELTIQEILAWDNGVEGYIIACDDNGREYRFLDTLFFAHKDSYEIGGTYPFSLSALSLNCEMVENVTFELSGEQAKSFLEKIGALPENGPTIEPVKFDTSDMVAFFQFDDECPDFAEFQSPIKDIDEFFINHQPSYRIDIIIDDEWKVVNKTLPLYITQNKLNQPIPNQPIRGVFCLQGHCINPLE